MLRLYSTLAKNKPAATQPFGLSLNLLYFYHRGILAGDVIGLDWTRRDASRSDSVSGLDGFVKAIHDRHYLVLLDPLDQVLGGWVFSLQIKGQNIPHRGQDAARSNPNAKPVSEPGRQEDRFGRLPERSSSSRKPDF